MYNNPLPSEEKSMYEMYACIILCKESFTSEAPVKARTKQCGVIVN